MRYLFVDLLVDYYGDKERGETYAFVRGFGHKTDSDDSPDEYPETMDGRDMDDAISKAEQWAANILQWGDTDKVVILVDGNEYKVVSK